MDSRKGSDLACSHTALGAGENLVKKFLNKHLNKKPVQVILWILAIGYGIYVISDFAGMARQRNVRVVVEQMNTVVEQSTNSPPGIQRVEIFLQKLKAIDTSAVPDDLKQAVNDYIASFEKGLNEMKSTQNTVTSYDNEIAEKKEKLAEVIQKYLTKNP